MKQTPVLKFRRLTCGQPVVSKLLQTNVWCYGPDAALVLTAGSYGLETFQHIFWWEQKVFESVVMHFMYTKNTPASNEKSSTLHHKSLKGPQFEEQTFPMWQPLPHQQPLLVHPTICSTLLGGRHGDPLHVPFRSQSGTWRDRIRGINSHGRAAPFWPGAEWSISTLQQLWCPDIKFKK